MGLVAVFFFAAWLIVIASAIAFVLGVKAYGNPGTDWVTFQFAVRIFAAPWLLFVLGGVDGIEIAIGLFVNPYTQDSGIPMFVFQPVGVFLFWVWRQLKARDAARAASESSEI